MKMTQYPRPHVSKEKEKIMKKCVKAVSAGMVLLLICMSLFGCFNLDKKTAFVEYRAALADDADLLNSLQGDMEKVNKSINSGDWVGVKAGLQAKINPSLLQLNQNAVTRHANITDPELINIDNHYVNYTKNMSDAFVLLLDGINTEDQAKLARATGQLTLAKNEITEYVNGMKKYMDAYGIKDDGTVAELQSMLSN